MKIIFDSEEQMKEFKREQCPGMVLDSIPGPHFVRDCPNDNRCEKCWEDFQAIVLEVNDNGEC